MSILNTRRRFLANATKASSLLLAVQISPVASALQRTPQPLPSPNAPTNQNVPSGMNQYPAGNSQRPSGYNGTQLNEMVQRLYQMTLDLKQETDRTNLQNILPADFLKKAQQIEKLAKSIRNYASS